MPRVPDNFLDAVVFLYPRREEAEQHAKAGGTAFMVGCPIEIDDVETPFYVPYMVTCRHVAWGSPVIRMNRRDGNPPDIVDLEIDDWIAHPDGYDVAATCMLGKIDHAIHSIKYLRLDKIFSREHARYWRIGIGDEVVMIGRLVNYQGRRDNEASVRFGRISKPPRPIYNAGITKDQESWAVEMQSRTGFSGSPVATWRNIFTILDDDLLADVARRQFFGLLGINWGYIKDEDGENTWLNGVVPSWQILETLEVPALANKRKEAIEAVKNANGKQPNEVAELAVAVPPASDANPKHREDFNSLLNAAVRKPERED
ncbi:MAG: hypothetical protein ABSA90_06330 [Xanthobacteraceae bacterium]|jgi:hypothetical protein